MIPGEQIIRFKLAAVVIKDVCAVIKSSNPDQSAVVGKDRFNRITRASALFSCREESLDFIRLWINNIEACTLTAHEDISSAIKIHRKDAIEAFRQLVAVADFLERIMSIAGDNARNVAGRSEEHTSELQSRENLVCRLLLEKK